MKLETEFWNFREDLDVPAKALVIKTKLTDVYGPNGLWLFDHLEAMHREIKRHEEDAASVEDKHNGELTQLQNRVEELEEDLGNLRGDW